MHESREGLAHDATSAATFLTTHGLPQPLSRRTDPPAEGADNLTRCADNAMAVAIAGF